MTTEKIAVVTGANRGIGKEIARALSQNGVKVILTARDPNKGEKVASDFKAAGLDIVFHALDVTLEESMKSLAVYVEQEFGKLDILVNNAALGGGENSLRISTSDFRKTFETNLFGPFRLSQLMIPLLKKSKDGRIVNISSGMGALKGMGGGDVAYRVSKTALNSITAVMAADLSGTSVKVNAMCPGWVKTDMGGPGAPRTVEKGAETAVWLALEKNIPSGKFFRDKKIIEW
jgi:NAD(P)-dependent dehydrogenase (short-subunit alcohol dehydrogenase family)